MNWFILFSVLLVVGIILIVLADKLDYKVNFNTDYFSGTGIIFLIVSGLVLPIMGDTLAGIESDFKKTINEYEYTKELVVEYNAGDYGNAPALMEKVININDEIARNKAKYDNPWTNLWYSEDIANLEPIKFNMNDK